MSDTFYDVTLTIHLQGTAVTIYDKMSGAELKATLLNLQRRTGSISIESKVHETSYFIWNQFITGYEVEKDEYDYDDGI